jgi:S-adenosylmethionine hydrolase
MGKKTITFLSDFGSDDWFTAAVKGEILKIASDIQIVDVTHNIAPFDIRGAAFLLSAFYRNFPKGTVHLAVVDPGVGTERKPIIVDSFGYYFVGPDNGLFSYVHNSKSKVYEIQTGVMASSTFHARDIFGPAAARLACGVGAKALGRKLSKYLRFEPPKTRKKSGQIYGEIVYIDHFGNCITNIPNKEPVRSIEISGRSVQIKKNYSQDKTKALVCIKGSIGYYEIASYKGNASAALNANVGTRVEARGITP